MTTKLSTDLLYGAEAISEFIGLEVRQAFHLMDSRQLPVFKIGKKWVARKSTLTRFFEEAEQKSWPSPG